MLGHKIYYKAVTPCSWPSCFSGIFIDGIDDGNGSQRQVGKNKILACKFGQEDGN